MSTRTPEDTRGLLPIVIAIGSLGTFGFSLTPPILPDLARELAVSQAAIGLVQGAAAIPGILVSWPIGYLADRLGRRTVVLTCLLIFATAGTGCFFTRTYWPLVGMRVLQGLGTSGLLGLGIALIGDLFPPGERTKAMGYNLAGLTTAQVLAPVVAGVLGAGGAFRPFLLFLIGFPLYFWALRLPRGRPDGVAPSPLVHLNGAIHELRARGRLLEFAGVLAGAISLVTLLHGLGLVATPLFLDEVFGVGPAARGPIVAAYSAAAAVAALCIGRVSARLGRGGTITFAFAFVATGFLVMALAPSPFVVAAGLGLAGFGFGNFIPVAQTYATSVIPSVYRGAMVGTWVTCVRTGQVLGPNVAAVLLATTGHRPTFAAGLALASILTFAWRPLHRAAARR